MKTLALIALFSLVLAAMPGAALAQETTGAIGGRVVDPQGLAIPGASVTITGPQGAKRVATDADGRFTAPFLTPGTYAVKVEFQGFKSVERTGFALDVGQTL